ncbi:MAG: serine protease [Xenococcus sp. (in: cyanobacteria)]
MRKIFNLFLTLACVGFLVSQCPRQTSLEFQRPDASESLKKLSNLEILRRAKRITVRVFPKSPEDYYKASGIIVDMQKQKLDHTTFYIYLVLTTEHVLEGLEKRANIYQVQTFDNKIYQAFLYPEVNWNGNDLGLLFFFSLVSYDKAELGSSNKLRKREKVFVAGFPCTDINFCQDKFKFTSGQSFIELIQQKKHLDSGYQLGFDNQTIDGMSGGPVLNQRGLVIGVNGRGKYQYVIFRSGHSSISDVNPLAYMDGEEPPPKIQEKLSNYAWAIPIETYLKYKPKKIFNRIAIPSLEDFE